MQIELLIDDSKNGGWIQKVLFLPSKNPFAWKTTGLHEKLEVDFAGPLFVTVHIVVSRKKFKNV